MVFNTCNAKILLFLESKHAYVKKTPAVDGTGDHIFTNKYIGNTNGFFRNKVLKLEITHLKKF